MKHSYGNTFLELFFGPKLLPLQVVTLQGLGAAVGFNGKYTGVRAKEWVLCGPLGGLHAVSGVPKQSSLVRVEACFRTAIAGEIIELDISPSHTPVL